MSTPSRILSTIGSVAALGPRLPGSRAEADCHRIALEWLRERGVGSVTAEGFDFLDWKPISQSFVSPGGEPIPALQLGFSPPGDITGEVHHCGCGSEDECEGSRGKLAVCSSGLEGSLRFLHRIQKYRNAVRAGALAFVLVGEPGHNPPLGIIRKRQLGQIPAVSVPHEAGRDLLDMGRADGRFRMATVSRTTTGRSRNVVWRMGGRRPGIVLSAHCDSWTQGAWDNASGVASLLVLADWLAGQEVAHDVAMCFTGAEEFGLFGSRHFCSRHPGEFAFAVNVDGVGLRGAELQARCSDQELAGMPPLKGVYSELPLTPWGDHFAFHRAGLRTVFLTSGGASPVQHTGEDTPDCINPTELGSSQALLQEMVAYLDSIL